jgi:hypothetical protein
MPILAAYWPEWWENRFFVLLDTAKTLKDQGHSEAAIVTAQTACEVCTEVFLEAGFRNKGISYLNDPVEALLHNNYNLGNDRVRNLYAAVCDDPIQQEPFWSSFKEHVWRRHRVVHRGKRASQQEAEASIAVAEEVVRHIRRNAGYES